MDNSEARDKEAKVLRLAGRKLTHGITTKTCKEAVHGVAAQPPLLCICVDKTFKMLAPFLLIIQSASM